MSRRASPTGPTATVERTTISRHSADHRNSSAFSSNANPNEDWTKISDLAERRRIQNRIAQRNYRKKLKRRLEDLERRAASASPEPQGPLDKDAFRSHPPQFEQVRSREPSVTPSDRSVSPALSHHSALLPFNDEFDALPSYYRQQHSPSPPVLSHSPFSAADSIEPIPATHFSDFHAPQDGPFYQSWRTEHSAPFMAQSHSFDGATIKQEFADDHYSFFAGGYRPQMEYPRSHSWQDETPHTPPLSEANYDSFDECNPDSPDPELWFYPTPPLVEDESTTPPFFADF